MKQVQKHPHSIGSLFCVLLFGLFALFLLLLVVFSARAYRAAARDMDTGTNLGTAADYLVTKFRQHDSEENLSLREFRGQQALCFTDVIEGQEYHTYIYLQDGRLKELFTASGSAASPDMGTPIASLSEFSTEETDGGFYRITMKDENGIQSSFLLHPGSPLTQ